MVSCYCTIGELQNERQQAECWQVVNKVQQQLRVRYAPNGAIVGLNIGPAAGQKFAHASVCAIPCYVGDVLNPSGGVQAW